MYKILKKGTNTKFSNERFVFGICISEEHQPYTPSIHKSCYGFPAHYKHLPKHRGIYCCIINIGFGVLCFHYSFFAMKLVSLATVQQPGVCFCPCGQVQLNWAHSKLKPVYSQYEKVRRNHKEKKKKYKKQKRKTPNVELILSHNLRIAMSCRYLSKVW